MNSYERIYEMLVYPDPIEEDLRSAAASVKRAVLHPAQTTRRAITRRLPKTGRGGKLRRNIAGARRYLGPQFRDVVATTALTGAALLGAHALPETPEKAPAPVEKPATKKVAKRGDIKLGLGLRKTTRIARGKK